VDQLGSEDMLMYASHYPRVHAAEPEPVLLRHLSQDRAAKIRGENARKLYRL
jgi:predicted TIM-barrel fold metal-dependent hydrolase